MLHHVTMGEGLPLLILHGTPLDHRYMVEAIEPVFDGLDGWERIYPDMPGYGQSPARDDIRSQDDLLAAVLAFVDERLPGARFGVVGLSRGSYIARGMVHLRPQRIAGAALLLPGGNPSADPSRLPRHQVIEPDPSMEAELAPEDVWRFENFMVVQRRDILERARRTVGPARALWDEAQERRVMANFDFGFHQRGEATVFDGPSLIVAGRQDSLSGYRDAMDLTEQFPRATLAVLDAAGHGLAFERPALLQALMRDWLARLRHGWPGPA
ncbi:alpha/beta fold hydrolase [Antarctobacter heliothermus]|uniref:Pimeloyl-ACP methyl ester carboxylesterase n=1 Tax=Antarctobacter heliothermus TaxID=74033 RepID=A0A239CB24_9RHOB|nr:alpha/beta hydrolase [Antarctobacter heliothermus]SNS17159.1 Pimeloyl-ACP methyl ester carboxylesterase [Antarctobacter heliothermus]